jgi:hypothetical protein
VDRLTLSPSPATVAAVLATLLALAALVLRRVRRTRGRTPAAVVVAALGALLCTAYSGDTSWSFARDHLGMHGATERGVMFAAAELGLFAMALMARQNLRTVGAPGAPGALVWVVTGVQVIPAYSETGAVAGTVRAFVGPVLAALLWHLAMGIELRHRKPGEESQSLPAVLVRELRERLLSYLGLSRRGRDAEQITRDRWTRIATRRAARLAELQESKASGRRRARAHRKLAAAVDRTDAGVLAEQRTVLLERIAAYRTAGSLASMPLTAPWVPSAVRTESGVPEVEVERVPDTAGQAYPELPRAVPVAVPAGVRLLPLVARPDTVQPPAVEAVPESPEYTLDAVARMMRGEPTDDSPPPPAEDDLTPQARRDFLADLVEQRIPSIRALKDRYGVGQLRATRIQNDLKARLA